MTPVRVLTCLLATAALVAGMAGCTEPGGSLNDDAACPGETCTDDTQARFDAIARLDDITAVETVSRSYGFDRGASRSAEVTASVDTPEAAREVGLAVLTELDNWPDQADGSAVVVVRADGGSPVRQSYVDEQPLPAAFYDACEPAACENGLARLVQVLEEMDGVVDLDLAVRDDTLVIGGSAPDVPAAQAAKAILDRVETDLDLRVADRVEVRIDYVAPLEVTLRLDAGRVCEQPPGLTVACNSDNSEPFPR